MSPPPTGGHLLQLALTYNLLHGQLRLASRMGLDDLRIAADQRLPREGCIWLRGTGCRRLPAGWLSMRSRSTGMGCGLQGLSCICLEGEAQKNFSLLSVVLQSRSAAL